VVPARRSLASIIALPVSSRSPRGEGIAPREDDSAAESVPSMKGTPTRRVCARRGHRVR
jgi:hypothetical protein